MPNNSLVIKRITFYIYLSSKVNLNLNSVQYKLKTAESPVWKITAIDT